jgi:hypothetical protein
VLEKRGFGVDTPVIKDLRTQDLDGFPTGLVRTGQVGGGNLARVSGKALQGGVQPDGRIQKHSGFHANFGDVVCRWHDQNAKRVFGHYDQAVFVLDRLDNGLGH